MSLPLLATIAFFFSFATVTMAQNNNKSEVVNHKDDPKLLVDTILTINPITLEESIKIVTYHPDHTSAPKPVDKEKKLDVLYYSESETKELLQNKSIEPSQLDTIMVLDPTTLKESVKYLMKKPKE